MSTNNLTNYLSWKSMNTILPSSVRKRNKKKGFAKKKVESLSVLFAYEIFSIFKDKNWISHVGYEFILERFKRILGILNDDQKGLIIDLTRRFYWKNDYSQEIVTQLNKILSHFNHYQNFYILRCVKFDDERSVKSSGVVAYEVKNPLIQAQLVKPVTVLDNRKALESKKIDFESSLFILVDDIVGTGDSAEKCIKELIDLKDKKNKKNIVVDLEGRMVVMCVVALEQGIKKLKNFHIPVFADHIQKRGISDYYTGYKLIKNLQLMQQIEDKIESLDPMFSFGYGRSEALICLKRCPNNTFPIFWYAKHSPYPRS